MLVADVARQKGFGVCLLEEAINSVRLRHINYRSRYTGGTFDRRDEYSLRNYEQGSRIESKKVAS